MPAASSSSPRPLALVTGASSGIGADLARELARDGHDLILVARRVAPMDALAAELGGGGAKVTVVAADLSKPGAAMALAADLDARGLVPDVLVNNAGLGSSGSFAEQAAERVSDMLEVNVVALTELTRALLPGMVARGRGRVLLVASTAAYQPGPGMSVYCATKAYVLSFGEAIGFELAKTGVSVTVLCPGPTTTEFFSAAGAQNAPILKSGLVPKMTSAEVARQGYAALKSGQRVIVTGAINKLGALSAPFTPRAILLPLAKKLMSSH